MTRRGSACGRAAATGFTLLEAIIALVIFSMGALALYGWLGSNLKTLERVDVLQRRDASVRSGLQAIRLVNPLEEPRGRMAVGSHVFEWESQEVEPVRRAVSQVGLPTIFEVGLFEMQVRVLEGGAEVGEFSVRQLGHRQVGALEED
ncbi:PulJ/GspJ family protein [Novilysobacter spongiicola]|uniref:General secretion pathway protein I n=1 Tax=Lysobacter spongiicola DSM 21749 TaxID=1122188 RepID=A0A1T4PEZ6_9GAMM|nr:prepilin-type N-terminal cleavage/methylation domain-containing protein [Lysobacter spongiicola]SJZ90135.1 general secretion pathway protein I [Lysobacter spongiicola DSM 21749]